MKKVKLVKLPDPKTQPTLSVTEAGELFGLSKDQAYRAVARGTIPSLRLGPRRIVCPTIPVLRLLGYEDQDIANM